MNYIIPFNKPHLTGKEVIYIEDAHTRGQLAGDGFYAQKCHDWLEKYYQCEKALLTHSCTAALEMSAILLDIQPGDEIIMPSYTFVSTANAFVLRGAVPVFVDINILTLNIDDNLIQHAITSKTKAIVVVHYAGFSCNMERLMQLAKAHNLYVVEDSAQALMSTYKGKPLGSFGDLSCLSFHETKNIICGEGGALIINNPSFIERAEIIREKGTNRSSFFRGEVSKYTWVDVGSSYLPGELNAAFLLAQLEHASWITQTRLQTWNYYQSGLKQVCSEFPVLQPTISLDIQNNGHIYHLLFDDSQKRNNFISLMASTGIQCVFHYIPLHNSPAGLIFAREGSSMDTTLRVASSIVRLPLYIGIDESYVIGAASNIIEELHK